MIRSLNLKKRRLVLIGNGMAGARLLEDILAIAPEAFDITVIGDEPHGNYNRILLSNVLNGTQAEEEIVLNPREWYQEQGISLLAGKRATRIDREAKVVHTADTRHEYDELVIATGSKPFVPPIPGTNLAGVFVFRTLDDCRAIASHARQCTRAVVLGGGLLGLEAAKGLLAKNMEVTIVEMAPWLMSVQVDETGGAILRKTFEKLGIQVRTGTVTKELIGEGQVSGVRFGDGSEIAADMVVISAGIRPNVDLVRGIGLECDRALVVNDQMGTSDPHVHGVGECVQHRGMVYGLVAPLWEQTKTLAQVITGAYPHAIYPGSRIATKLKVIGVELASMGRISDLLPTDEVVQYTEPARDIYWKAIIRDGRIHAACLIGDLGPADAMMRLYQAGGLAPQRRMDLFFGAPAAAKPLSLMDLPDDQQICDCNGVSKKQICSAIKAGKCTIPAIGKATRAGSGCGSCKKMIKGLIEELAGSVEADPSENWYVSAVPMEKPALVAAIREKRLKSVSAVLRELGNGDDEKSKAGLASLLKGMWGKEYVDERDSRYINDRVHANIQKDGTFSVVPRMYGGVSSADELIRIGEVAKKYEVPMVKITGGQRIDLLGIKKEDLPKVWHDLGMPSGHAYTKALRTVKTCVGSEYCRFGTNDSTSLGIALERRFQGFEFPAKVKLGVSGCPRNCAESTVKDVGIVATEGGEWEISVGGAAGAHVRKSDPLFRVGTQEEAITLIGRFLIYYRDNARWLERTYDFVPRVGLEKLRAILIEDKENLWSYLDGEVAKSMADYVDPWLERNEPCFPGQFEGPKKITLPMLA